MKSIFLCLRFTRRSYAVEDVAIIKARGDHSRHVWHQKHVRSAEAQHLPARRKHEERNSPVEEWHLRASNTRMDSGTFQSVFTVHGRWTELTETAREQEEPACFFEVGRESVAVKKKITIIKKKNPCSLVGQEVEWIPSCEWSEHRGVGRQHSSRKHGIAKMNERRENWWKKKKIEREKSSEVLK